MAGCHERAAFGSVTHCPACFTACGDVFYTAGDLFCVEWSTQPVAATPIQRCCPGAALRGFSPGRITVAVVPGGTSTSSSIDRPRRLQDTSMGPNGLT